MLYRVVATISGARIERCILEAPYTPGARMAGNPDHVFAAMRACLIEDGFDPADVDAAAYSLA